MRITDQVSHRKVDYRAKDFDAQSGQRFTMMTDDDNPIETGVYFHWKGDRPVDVAIDISCMSGCTHSCIFCAAGKTRARRLDAREILQQVSLAIERTRPSHETLLDEVKTNGSITFSFQAIGEPADRSVEANVAAAVADLRSAYSPQWRSVQFSISSILDNLSPLREWPKLGLHTLQFSLHAPNDEMRRKLLGQAGLTPIAQILSALDEFHLASPGTQIKINYVLIAGLNDTDDDCDDLMEILAERPDFYLKVSFLNETTPALHNSLRNSRRVDRFLNRCKAGHAKTYRYGAVRDLHISCGQLASYAGWAEPSLKNNIADLYRDISLGRCTVFLGAGASYTAWSARNLAGKLSDQLRGAAVIPEGEPTLAEIADIYERHGRRQEVDAEIRSTLNSAKVPGAMFDLPRYAWRGIYTTNYDEFVERAYAKAAEAKYARQVCLPVLSPGDFGTLAPGTVPLIKLHGSVSEGLRTILSETDYLDGYNQSIEFFLHRLTSDFLEGSLLFVGYSFRDQFIKQWFFDLKRRLPRVRGKLWVVQPPSDRSDFDGRKLDDQLGAKLLPIDFAGLMAELELLRRRPVVMASGSKKRIVRGDRPIERRGDTSRIDDFCGAIAEGLDEREFRLVTGATATDKVGYLIGSRMKHGELVTTYAWQGAEDEDDNEIQRMIHPTKVGRRPMDVVERMMDEATVLLVVGGGALTLRECLTAMSRGIPVIPIAIGGPFASDVVWNLFRGQRRAVGLMAGDSGVDARFGDKMAHTLTQDRLERLRLDSIDARAVAAVALEIVDHIAAIDSEMYIA